MAIGLIKAYFIHHRKPIQDSRPDPLVSDELFGVKNKPAKRGPASVLQRQIEQIGLLPKSKQKMISEVIDAMIKQQHAS